VLEDQQLYVYLISKLFIIWLIFDALKH